MNPPGFHFEIRNPAPFPNEKPGSSVVFSPDSAKIHPRPMLGNRVAGGLREFLKNHHLFEVHQSALPKEGG